MAATNYGKYTAITANNTFQTLIVLSNPLQYRIYGTFSASVAIQIKRPDQADTEFSTVKTVTAPDAGILDLIGTWDVRIGTTAFTSGTVQIETS